MSGWKLESVTKSYDGYEVLHGLTYVFPGKSITCITGPSGSGKTTLLRILAGLEKPDAGSISRIPETVSFVFQEDRLAEPFNAVSNVALAANKGVSHKQIEAELAVVGITDFKKPVRDFSGGMKRRVAIVRAMLADAELYLLDEPFKGLDPALRDKVLDYVLRKTKGKTVVAVTHDRDEVARMSGNVLVLG